jgi:hypothetical protein
MSFFVEHRGFDALEKLSPPLFGYVWLSAVTDHDDAEVRRPLTTCVKSSPIYRVNRPAGMRKTHGCSLNCAQ